MGSYKLSEDAQADLIRIHQRGVRRYGEAQADKYYYEFIERFEQLAGVSKINTTLPEIWFIE